MNKRVVKKEKKEKDEKLFTPDDLCMPEPPICLKKECTVKEEEERCPCPIVVLPPKEEICERPIPPRKDEPYLCKRCIKQIIEEPSQPDTCEVHPKIPPICELEVPSTPPECKRFIEEPICDEL